MDQTLKTPILEVVNISKSFRKGDQQQLVVLENINFSMYAGEIIAILGRSGSGKSTLLRILAGLDRPNSGTAYYRGKPIFDPVYGMSMVFQTFALLPWLTVSQNVELGLEAQKMPLNDMKEKVCQVIDMIGLNGFENAYPKELSGGMRQRVGFARALVVNPDILIMDEPFSALDVLTADNLKSDLLDLWHSKKTGLHGILFVTHNITEAVTLANRILVFNNDPGSIRAELPITLPYPRNDIDPSFRKQVDKVYTFMTTQPRHQRLKNEVAEHLNIDLGYRLPDASVAEIIGLLEILNEPERQGKMDLPEVAEILMMNIDDLFPLTELLDILHFAKVSKGDIAITEVGQKFVTADIVERKKIFSEQLKTYVPLASFIYEHLIQHPSHRALEEYFLTLLANYLSPQEAERVLQTIIEYSRYAELFTYDYNSGVLSIKNNHHH